MTAFLQLAALYRERAEILWRNGDYIQASALHTRALKLEAGCTEAELDTSAARNHRNGRAA